LATAFTCTRATADHIYRLFTTHATRRRFVRYRTVHLPPLRIVYNHLPLRLAEDAIRCSVLPTHITYRYLPGVLFTHLRSYTPLPFTAHLGDRSAIPGRLPPFHHHHHTVHAATVGAYTILVTHSPLHFFVRYTIPLHLPTHRFTVVRHRYTITLRFPTTTIHLRCVPFWNWVVVHRTYHPVPFLPLFTFYRTCCSPIQFWDKTVPHSVRHYPHFSTLHLLTAYAPLHYRTVAPPTVLHLPHTTCHTFYHHCAVTDLPFRSSVCSCITIVHITVPFYLRTIGKRKSYTPLQPLHYLPRYSTILRTVHSAGMPPVTFCNCSLHGITFCIYILPPLLVVGFAVRPFSLRFRIPFSSTTWLPPFLPPVRHYLPIPFYRALPTHTFHLHHRLPPPPTCVSDTTHLHTPSHYHVSFHSFHRMGRSTFTFGCLSYRWGPVNIRCSLRPYPFVLPPLNGSRFHSPFSDRC